MTDRIEPLRPIVVWEGDHSMGPGWEQFVRSAHMPPPLIDWLGGSQFTCGTCHARLYDSRPLDAMDCPMCKTPMRKEES